MDDAKRKRFLWGALLAWIPLLFFMLPVIAGIFDAFRDISQHKATGIAAVAGGFAELLLIFGLAVALAFEITAIVLLLRAFSKQHPMRAMVSILSILCSGFMITILGLFLWFFFKLPHS